METRKDDIDGKTGEVENLTCCLPPRFAARQRSRRRAIHPSSQPSTSNRTVEKEDSNSNKEREATQEPTVLFLLGKTGNGKSKTGNKILGREFFDASDSSSSKTIDVKVGYARRQDRQFKVVDSPGIGHTQMSHEEADEHIDIAKQMQRGVNACSEGIHALILVLRYASRFTDDEWATVCALKKLFGESFIRDYCIIIFTHGDNFYKKIQKTPGKTFQDWCKEQKGKLEELFSECQHRIVLFDNFADSEHADSQLKRLLYFVDNKIKPERYTNKIFEMAGEARKKAIAQNDSWKVAQENIYSRLHFILDGIERLRSHKEMNDEACELLENLRLDVKNLQITIEKEVKETGALKPLRQIVTGLLKTINNLDPQLRESHTQARSDEKLATANKQLSEEQKKVQEEVDKVDEPSFWNTMKDVGQKALAYSVETGLIEVIPGGSMIAGVYKANQKSNSE